MAKYVEFKDYIHHIFTVNCYDHKIQVINLGVTR